MSKSMDKRIAIQSQPEKITQEQAVEIAEWLCCQKRIAGNVTTWYGKVRENVYLNMTAFELIKWLYSPQGQEALMDKLDSTRVDHRYERGGTICWLSWNMDDYNFPQKQVSSQAKTRQDALLLAVLEMLEGGE